MRLRTRYTQRLPVAPGLRLDMPMFEGSGTKVLDVSGKGNHGTIMDAVWTRDENGVAMTFNGTSAYIDCGNDASQNITDAITIEAWIKVSTAIPNYPTIVSKLNGNNWQDSDYWLSLLAKSGLIFYMNGIVDYRPAYSFSDGIWYHVTAVYNSSEVEVYINGDSIGSTSATGTINTTGGNLLIGHTTASAINPFDGTIDNVRIYAVALTAEQIKRRYEQTKRDYVRAH